MAFVSGPFVAVLINKFSHRSVYMASGILCLVAMVATAFSPSLFIVYITYGVLVGKSTFNVILFHFHYGKIDIKIFSQIQNSHNILS